MAAESLLGWFEAEIHGQPLVVSPPVHAAVEAAHEADVEQGQTLDIYIQDTDGFSATIVADGILDRQSYHKVLMQTQRLYSEGIRDLRLDLANVTKVDLSGIYALHPTAKIFGGECYPRYEYGYAGLRHMVEENLQAGPHRQIQLTAINEQAQDTLDQSGIIELFSL